MIDCQHSDKCTLIRTTWHHRLTITCLLIIYNVLISICIIYKFNLVNNLKLKCVLIEKKKLPKMLQQRFSDVLLIQ